MKKRTIDPITSLRQLIIKKGFFDNNNLALALLADWQSNPQDRPIEIKLCFNDNSNFQCNYKEFINGSPQRREDRFIAETKNKTTSDPTLLESLELIIAEIKFTAPDNFNFICHGINHIYEASIKIQAKRYEFFDSGNNPASVEHLHSLFLRFISYQSQINDEKNRLRY